MWHHPKHLSSSSLQGCFVFFGFSFPFSVFQNGKRVCIALVAWNLLCLTGFPQTHHDLLASASQILWIKCTTCPTFSSGLHRTYSYPSYSALWVLELFQRIMEFLMRLLSPTSVSHTSNVSHHDCLTWTEQGSNSRHANVVRRKTTRPQPYTKKYGQLRNASRGRNCSYLNVWRREM